MDKMADGLVARKRQAGAETDSNGEWDFKEESGEDAFRDV